MRLWSRGLGKLILPLDLESSETHLTPEHIVFSGTIREGKIIWPYTIKMKGDDLMGFTTTLLQEDVREFLARRNGLKLLWTIFVYSLVFAWGLLRTLVGKGYPVVEEKDLGLGPKPLSSRGKRVRTRRPRVGPSRSEAGDSPGPPERARVAEA